jgi:ribosomal protein L18
VANSTSGYIIRRSTSSLKYKKEIEDSIHGLTEVLLLRPVTYKGKSEADNNKVVGGLIAEEVHKAGLTEFVQYADDGTPDALAYGNMVSLCIKAIQEQQALITTLTARIEALEAK